MIRKFALILAALVGLDAFATTVPVTSTDQTITPHVTACFNFAGAPPAFTTDTTGNAYKCVSGKWERADLPPCPANPPSGAAPGGTNGNTVCRRTDTGGLYGADGSGNWASLSGSGATVAGATDGLVQIKSGSSLTTAPMFSADASTGAVKTKILNGQYYATAYADSGTGATGSCWATAGSNPIAAALAACPSTGCDVILNDGCYTLGTADPAIEITKISAVTDKRVYRIIGRGKDKSILNYTGSGTAIRYWQDHTGTPGASIQSNANMLRGFALRQTNSDRTGVGIWINYASRWTFDDLSIGTMRTDRATTQTGFSYGIKMAERTGSYRTVDDFNTIENCYFSGNTHAVYASQQADNLRVRNNYFEGNPNVSAAQDGLEFKNGNALSVIGNTFNFFKFSNSMFAVRTSTDVSAVEISGNYFEGNWTAVSIYSDQDQDGIHISGNLFSTNSVTGTSGQPAFGIDAGLGSSTWFIRGLVISGNTFDNIGDYEYGVRLRGEVRNAVLEGNQYRLAGTTNDYNNVILPGATVTIVGEGSNTQSTQIEQPQVAIWNTAPDYNGLVLENRAEDASCTASGVPFACCTGAGTGTCTGNSPRIIWKAGGNSHLYMFAYADSAGSLNFLPGSGTASSISSAGVFAGGVTVGASQTVNAAAGKLRLPNSTTLPVTCTVGDSYQDNNATTTAQFYLCTSTDVWTAQGGGGGGSGDALVANPLSQFASTTSAQLASVISNETGTGLLVYGTSPVLTTPNIGVATGSVTGNAGTVTTSDAAGDTTTFPLLGIDATGSLAPRTDPGLSYDASTNTLTTTTVIAALNGNASTSTLAATATVADSGSDSTTFPMLAPSVSGSLGSKTDPELTYDASTDTLGAGTVQTTCTPGSGDCGVTLNDNTVAPGAVTALYTRLHTVGGLSYRKESTDPAGNGQLIFGGTYARVTGSDVTRTAQTLADVTGLTVPLITGRTYEYEAVLMVTTSADTTGTQYGVAYTSTASLIEGALSCTLASATPTVRMERVSALATASSVCMTTSASTVGAVTIRGIITTTGSGNFTIQHLKTTSGTSTVKVGSYLKLTRIA